MENKPLVSIITPMYNAEQYIQETIESVLSQTYTNWEMIIVDNCSTDKSKEIVQKFITQDYRIRLIELNRNSGGPARPRNIGIKVAKGEYIAFLDADDLWIENKLELQIKIIESSGIGLVFSNVMYINEKSEKIYKKFKPKLPHIIDKKSHLLVFNNFIALSSVMVSKNFLGNSVFIEEKDFIASEDRILWHELNQKGEFYYCSLPLIKYRIHKKSISSNKIKRLQLNDKVLNYIENKFDYDSTIIKLAKIVVDIKRAFIEKKIIRIVLGVLKFLIYSFYNRKFMIVIKIILNIK